MLDIPFSSLSDTAKVFPVPVGPTHNTCSIEKKQQHSLVSAYNVCVCVCVCGGGMAVKKERERERERERREREMKKKEKTYLFEI